VCNACQKACKHQSGAHAMHLLSCLQFFVGGFVGLERQRESATRARVRARQAATVCGSAVLHRKKNTLCGHAVQEREYVDGGAHQPLFEDTFDGLVLHTA